MKKIVSLIILSVLFLSQVQTIMANPFTTRLTSTATSIEAGQSFTVTLEVRGSTGLYGLTANLNFDSNKLEITGSSAQSGFALTLGSKIVLDHTESRSGNFNVARITFKAKSAFAVGESTQISISNVVGFDGRNEVSGSQSSITINVVPPKSTNNFLSNLSVNVGSIPFNRATLNYTLIVDHDVTSANISATAEDSKATVSGAGNKTLRVYSNVFNITVTAENGSTRRYSINIIRRDASGNAGALSTNNALRSLTLDVCALNFSADVLEYACEVDNLVDTYILNIELADARSSITREGPQNLSLGPNIIKLSVAAESGDVRVYTITITRSTSAPTVRLDQLEEALKTIASDEIGVIAPIDGVIDPSILRLIRDAQKILIVRGQDEHGKTLYEWLFDGRHVVPGQPIRTLVTWLPTHQDIDSQTNFAQGLILKFESNVSLPVGTRVKYYLNDTLSQHTTLNLYFFNPSTQQLELKHENLVVEDNFVWIPLEHTSTYFLTPASLQNRLDVATPNQNIMLWIGLSIAQFVVILFLAVLVLKQKKSLS